jgi:hypothetical protein
MEPMTESWTDARLDDFAKHVDHRFDAVDQRFDAVDQRFEAVDQRFDAVDQRFEAVDQRFEAMDRRFDAVDASLRDITIRFDGLHKLMFQASVLVIVALIGLIATQL